MPLTLRRMQPCRRCPGLPTCEIVSRELGNALERIARMSAKTSRALPHIEVALDCRSFAPARSSSSSNRPPT